MYRNKRSPFQERWKQHILPNSPHMITKSIINWDRDWALRMGDVGLKKYPLCKF